MRASECHTLYSTVRLSYILAARAAALRGGVHRSAPSPPSSTPRRHQHRAGSEPLSGQRVGELWRARVWRDVVLVERCRRRRWRTRVRRVLPSRRAPSGVCPARGRERSATRARRARTRSGAPHRHPRCDFTGTSRTEVGCEPRRAGRGRASATVPLSAPSVCGASAHPHSKTPAALTIPPAGWPARTPARPAAAAAAAPRPEPRPLPPPPPSPPPSPLPPPPSRALWRTPRRLAPSRAPAQRPRPRRLLRPRHPAPCSTPSDCKP